MARAKTKKSNITRGEKLLYGMTVFAFTLILFMKIFCGAKINNLKMNIESINGLINKENKTVESLTMKFNQLTSYENVKSTIREMGLAYNNNNIIVINDEN